MKRVLIVRSDNNGDVLLAEPAIRSVSAVAQVDLMVGPRGEQAARLLSGPREVLVHCLPWIDPNLTQVRRNELDRLVNEVKERRYDQAIILTSFHQSALPLALLLRFAGVPEIIARSEDYPGGLLDVRVVGDEDVHEVERSLRVIEAAGYRRTADDRIRLRPIESRVPRPRQPYLVLTPGGSASARQWPIERWVELVSLLNDEFTLVATGSADEVVLTSQLPGVVDLAGQTTMEDLAVLISGAAALISGNTGTVHLAAACRTPVVELFAPVVPLNRWSPWRTPNTVMVRPNAACAGTRVRDCVVPGHPCMSEITAHEVADALRLLLKEAA